MMRIACLLVTVTMAVVVGGCNRSTLAPSDARTQRSENGPVKLTDDNFQREVLKSDLPVLVDMWAPWCQPCIAMKPTIRKLASEFSGVVKVAELNIEESPFIKQKYNVDKIPMLLIFVDGNEVQRLVGAKSREDLLAALSNHSTNNLPEDKVR